MKVQKFMLSLFLLQTLMIFGCSKENEQLDIFTISKESTSFLPVESVEKVAITCSGKWEATTDASWIKLSPSNGEGNGSIEIAVEDNVEPTSRTASIYLVSGHSTKVFVVNQEKSDRSVTTDRQNIDVDFQNHEEVLAIKSTRSWKIASITDSWISVSSTSGNGSENVKITVRPNTLVGVIRSTSLQIISGKETATVTIKQDGKPLEFKINDNNIETDSNGGSKAITISANTSWKIDGEIPEWITVDSKQGIGNATLNITIAKHEIEAPRLAVLKIAALTGDNTLGNLSIKVYQTGKVIPNPLRVKDSLALVALYKSAGGEEWINKWDLSQPISTYHGITMKNDRVVEINLWDNGLKGSIPNEITELDKLWTLQLGNNKLTGTIPADWSKLNQLVFLTLAHNQLEGAIPTSIAKCGRLMELILSDNKLSGTIPTGLTNLEMLTNLLLSDNMLEGGIPSFKGQYLAMLHLHRNNLTGSIPSSIGNLNSLQRLTLFQNKLTGVVPSNLKRHPKWEGWEKYNLITLQQDGVNLPLL